MHWLRDFVAGRNTAGAAFSTASSGSVFALIFEPLRQFDGSLPVRCDRHICGKNDSSLLRELAALGRAAGDALDAFVEGASHVRLRRHVFYSVLDTYEPDVIARFGHVFLACVGSGLHGREWPEAMLSDAFSFDVSSIGAWRATLPPETPNIDLMRFERALMSDGMNADRFVMAAFASSAAAMTLRDQIVQLPGFGAALERHPETVRRSLADPRVDERLWAFERLKNLSKLQQEMFLPELAQAVVGQSARLRSSVTPLVVALGHKMIPSMRAIAIEGDPDHRIAALGMLWRLGRVAGCELEADFVRSRATLDAAASVRAAIVALLASKDVDSAPPSSSASVDIDPILRLAVSTRTALDAGYAGIDRIHQANRYQRDRVSPFDDRVKEQIWRVLHEPGAPQPVFAAAVSFGYSVTEELWGTFIDAPDVTLKHVARLFVAFDQLVERNGSNLHDSFLVAVDRLRRGHAGITLLDLERALAEFDILPLDVAHAYAYSRHIRAWPFEAAHNFFLQHQDLFVRFCTPNNDAWRGPHRMFALAKTFPEISGPIADHLFGIALGAAKTSRGDAQGALNAYPDKEDRIGAALLHGKAEVRAVAATWFADLDARSAIPRLEAAFHREKNDAAASALVSALERLGVAPETLLTRESLLADARRSLPKAVPAELVNILASLPNVRWRDGTLVDAAVVRWLIVSAAKTKNPEPGGILRHCVALFDRSDRERLGTHVLNSWMRDDLQPGTEAQCDALARRLASQQYATLHSPYQVPGYDPAAHPHYKLTQAQLYALNLPLARKTPIGSAVAAKGVLAVAAACCGPDAALAARKFLIDWYGSRSAQSKALVAMLAWIDDPAATQLLLATANRFRTRGIQEEALRHVQLLAERRGWTIDELADRTAPSVGFNDDGRLELTYGERSFYVNLDTNLEIGLSNSEGERIAALPPARLGDDEQLVAEAKRELTDTKKSLKQTVALQIDRLYDAMCVGRVWSYGDWRRYLQEHPIVGRLCVRLIWLRVSDDGASRAFQPLADGAFIDVDGCAIALSEGDSVTIAYGGSFTVAERKAWREHVALRRVAPLFDQLNRESFILSPEHRISNGIHDFNGYMVDSFKLRARAKKLNWIRGAAEDGGYYKCYTKSIASRGIAATLNFSGAPLPEEQRMVALFTLDFRSLGFSHDPDALVPLEDVPAIFVTECWNDVRAMAADGTGFDPQWAARVGY